MQHLYVLRRVSSWSFRLSMSVALLLSGAGLATSLLVSAAVRGADLPQVAWEPTLNFPMAASELATEQTATAQALPVSLSSMVPTYSFATSPAYSTPLPQLASGRLLTQPETPELDFLPTTSTVKITVQRSWDTFKLAFR
ncbi:MAG: hypothetical protein EOO56_16105 [Hymenobacter sp.]|nr:MAG: hypothetical protein EOO56_16105 [Hymenobacter sp.]